MPTPDRSSSPPSDPSAEISRSLDLARQLVPDAVDPREVVAVIDGLGIPYVLIGGHAVSILLAHARATVDVDLIVPGDAASAVATELASRFSHLDLHDFRAAGRGDNIRLAKRHPGPKEDPDRIDVIADAGVFGLGLHHRQAHGRGRNRIYLPTIESALGLKYAAGSSPHRAVQDRAKDRADFIALALSVAEKWLDLDILREFGLMTMPGAGDYEIELAVRKALRGQTPF